MVIEEPYKYATSSSFKKIEYVELENGCWECTSHAKSPKGYYKIRRRWFNGGEKAGPLHRYIYEIYKGEIPLGKIIRHTCDNRYCINPEHLIIGTHKDNNMDMVERDRHSRGMKSPNSKLTDEQVIEIYHAVGTQRDIASIYGIDHTTVGLIKRRKLWKHLTV
jgi:hypothetical protein